MNASTLTENTRRAIALVIPAIAKLKGREVKSSQHCMQVDCECGRITFTGTDFSRAAREGVVARIEADFSALVLEPQAMLDWLSLADDHIEWAFDPVMDDKAHTRLTLTSGRARATFLCWQYVSPVVDVNDKTSLIRWAPLAPAHAKVYSGTRNFGYPAMTRTAKTLDQAVSNIAAYEAEHGAYMDMFNAGGKYYSRKTTPAPAPAPVQAAPIAEIVKANPERIHIVRIAPAAPAPAAPAPAAPAPAAPTPTPAQSPAVKMRTMNPASTPSQTLRVMYRRAIYEAEIAYSRGDAGVVAFDAGIRSISLSFSVAAIQAAMASGHPLQAA